MFHSYLLQDWIKLDMLEGWFVETMVMLQLRLLYSTLIRLLDYAFCIILVEDAIGWSWKVYYWKAGKLGLGFLMFVI